MIFDGKIIFIDFSRIDCDVGNREKLSVYAFKTAF
jgi:hypothetical protein